MSQLMGIMIRGTGCGLPERVFTNADFEKILDTTDEWITSRTGIRERRFASEGESTLTMGLEAARNALDNAGMSADELDLIIFGTISPHYTLPATACLLQSELGLTDIPAFDISAACCGFMFGMIVAGNMILSGGYQNVLVVGSEKMSSISDFEDRTSCVLFGDGAGAAILSRTEDSSKGLIQCSMGADGSGAKMIWIPGGGSREPICQKVVDERLQFVRMKGREVYKFAVQKMHQVIASALEETGVKPEELALVIPHQSNLRIIESARVKLGLPADKMMVNIDRYGNTSSASVAICLDEARRAGRIQESDLILMVAFGAGLTWSSALIRL